MQPEMEGTLRVGIAALIGLGVGLEREWSGHASGPEARFAGLRTFLALGILGGVAGVLASRGFDVMGSVVVTGGAAIAVAAYVMATRHANASIDGTTETAALVVLALAAIAGLGWLTLATAAGAVLVLALNEKNELHAIVRRIGHTALHAALRFTVVAVAILPLLPAGPLPDRSPSGRARSGQWS